MTLKGRNKLIFTYLIATTAITIFLAVYFIILCFLGKINFFNSYFSSGLKSILFSKRCEYSYISSLVLLIYNCIVCYAAHRSFEKTLSTEIIYLLNYLIGTFLCGLNILTPIFNLTDSYSSFLMWLSKIGFAGQLLAILSFLCSSIFSEENQVPMAERNFYTIIAASAILASIVPVNVSKISESGIPAYGFSTLFIIAAVIIVIATTFSLYYSWSKRGQQKFLRIPIGYLLLIIGFFTMVYTDNLVSFLIGTIVYAFGTKHYLYTIHLYYLWK